MPAGLGFLVPLSNENRWTDLLAALICSDPSAAAKPLGLVDASSSQVEVAREVRADEHDRFDLIVKVDGKLRTVVEAKVLSGLGYQQLEKYERAYPGAAHYLLVYPQKLPIHPGVAPAWHGVTWETLLGAFATSRDAWVAETATAWLEHLARSLPEMNPDLRWNALREGEDFTLVMRARMSWVYGRLAPPPPISADLMQGGYGKAWVTRMQTPAAKLGYEAGAEAEERTARRWPRQASAGPNPLAGPLVWVGLRQHDVTTSAGFDWEYLRSMWPFMSAARSDWIAGRPGLPVAHDRAGWQRIGSPPTLGYGFGDRQAAKGHPCMFGAKFQLPADIRLGDFADELQSTAELLLQMSQING